MIVEAKSLTQLWYRSLKTVYEHGEKISGIQEIPNLVMKVEGNFNISEAFDKQFRKVFGDERIDYASSVTFVRPTSGIAGQLVYVQNNPKAKWTETYWGRLISWGGEINQVANAIARMKKDGKNTKMLSMSVYDPKSDHKKVMGGVPCMTAVDLKPRHGKLHLTAFFRSTRLSKSGYADMHALCQMMMFMADESGLQYGSVTLISTSAHCFYSGEEAKQAKEVLAWCDSQRKSK